MKPYIIHRSFRIVVALLCLLSILNAGYGQTDSSQTTTSESDQQTTAQPKSAKPVKNTFESIWILDNQTVMVPIKKTFELDFMHRFGTWDGGYQDLYGLFVSANVRFGFNFVPIDKLLVGVSLTEYNLTWEGYAKYALLKQTPGKWPVSITYYGDAALPTKKGSYLHNSDKWMFFHQLLIARKISDRFSIQVAPSITHRNTVQGFYTGDTTAGGKSVIEKAMHHDHFAIAFSGKVKLSNTLDILLNYDQPITKHYTNNPYPNLSAGLEINTSSHTFQIIVGNYQYITPSNNNYFNKNDFKSNQFLIGFNLTRVWNF